MSEKISRRRFISSAALAGVAAGLGFYAGEVSVKNHFDTIIKGGRDRKSTRLNSSHL